MGASQNAKRAMLLDMTLIPYQSADGQDFVRIFHGETELADLEESEVAAWLAAQRRQTATQRRQTAARPLRRYKARRRSSGMQVAHLVRFLSLGIFRKAGA